MTSGWGQYPQVTAPVRDFERLIDARDILAASESLIPQGMTRSYGDAALSDKLMLSTRRYNRMLDFDEETGRLRCQSGVTIADIFKTFVPRAWFVRVSPGTKFVSIGGAIAADVHGKNHHKVGSFSSGVLSFELLTAAGDIIRCSRDENSELFAATCGGMGLTGVIGEVELQLEKIPSAFAYQRVIKCANLGEAMAAFRDNKDWTYSVAWIDCLAKGSELGRSIVYLGEMATPEQVRKLRPRARDPFDVKTPTLGAIPFTFPNFALNGLTMKAFNALYYNVPRPTASVVDLNTYNYPLDKVLHWNRLYGSRGFFQYQCVFPLDTSADGLREVLDETARFGVASFLAVLKLFGDRADFLSFPMEGFTLTMDFPVSRGTLLLARRLDEIVEKYGGRMYLAKDARLDGGTFSRLEKDSLDAFNRVKREIDADGKFASLQSRRLGITQ